MTEVQRLPILDFPNEIIVQILVHSELDDIVSLVVTNRRMNSVAGSYFLDSVGFDRTKNDRIQFGGQSGIPFYACKGLVQILDWMAPTSSVDCCVTENLFEELKQLLPVLKLLPAIYNFSMKMSNGRDPAQTLIPSSPDSSLLLDLLTEIAVKNCKILFLQLPIKVDEKASSISIPTVSTLENLGCWSPWLLSNFAYQMWFVTSCNDSKIRNLSLVYVPQVFVVLQILDLPYLEEFQLSFDGPSTPSRPSHRSPRPDSYIPKATVLVDRGISDFFVRHPSITHLDLGMVSELFIVTPNSQPLPVTVFPLLKVLRVHINLLSFIISEPASLPDLKELEVHVGSSVRQLEGSHRRNLYTTGFEALSNHLGCIRQLRISVSAVRSSDLFPDFFSLQDISVPTVDLVEISTPEIDVYERLSNELVCSWVGRLFPNATEFRVSTTRWSVQRKKRFVSDVVEMCPSVARVGVDSVVKSIGEWLMN